MSGVAAVVVTFNRKELLPGTIDGLKSQDAPVDRIYIIDNASTDQTAEMLAESGYLEDPLIEYHRLDVNTGGAGGFSHGMKIAHAAGHEWIWTMDDDVVPAVDALSVLLSYTGISECLNCRKVFTQNDETQYWEQFYDFSTGRLVDLKNVSFRNGKSWCPVNVACFEGMLISCALIDKIGYPDPDYFIYQDDTAYGIKASFYTNVVYIRDAVFYKKIYGYGDPNPFRSYYMLRNTIKMKREIQSVEGVAGPTRYTNMLFFINLVRYSLSSFMYMKRYAMIKAIVKGWFHGLRGK